ncbi:helix-turn-helix transcriptional regulator [Streptosporangium sp. NPDC023615]|uniref:helix-turn-helix domain-containing protein n=1 Tax=Streptosporangium sp. NPDC023615 TaxID=3154794 RepID=UPI00341ABCFC
MASTTPTLRGRQLAARLRALREKAGLTVKEAAEGIECSPAKIQRIENAQRGAIPREVRDLCLLYGVREQDEIDTLMEMAREAKQAGIHLDIGSASVEKILRTYVGLEAAASSIWEFQTALVPGLLQTEEYARTLTGGMLPQITPDVLDTRVAIRVKRQEILTRPDPPKYWAVMDEAVLRKRIGGDGVMHEQLLHVTEIARLPNVTIQVVPFEAGAHMGINNPFVLFEIPDSKIPDIVYLESMTTERYLEKAVDTAPYKEAKEHIIAAALSPRNSMEKIEEMSRNYSAD